MVASSCTGPERQQDFRTPAIGGDAIFQRVVDEIADRLGQELPVGQDETVADVCREAAALLLGGGRI